jgi:hypothetical protein
VEVVIVRGQGRTETGIFRLLDGQRRRVVIHAAWGLRDGAVLAAVADRLSATERADVAAALGLDRPAEPA